MITPEIEKFFVVSEMISAADKEVALISGTGPRMSKKKRELLRPLSEKPEVSRNELCPCNSGKKYKKCCLTKPA